MSEYQEMLALIPPNKRFFSIGETSKLCKIKPHVLRYWEQEFPQLKPSKRRGGRRYYQHKDVVLICTISDLLYSKGFTITGAKQQLQENKWLPAVVFEKQQDKPIKPIHNVSQIIGNLEELLDDLKK